MYYNDDKETVLKTLQHTVPLLEQLEYFKSKGYENPEEKLIEFYGNVDILDLYSLEEIETELGLNFDHLRKIFDDAGSSEEFEEKMGNLKMYDYFYKKSNEKDTPIGGKLLYRKKCFGLADMYDVRLNPDGTVDLICDGLSDFVSWFYDGSVGRGGGNPKYMAEKLFNEEDFWEPYNDIVQDFVDDVWNNISEENLKYIKTLIKEKYLDGIQIDKTDYESISDLKSDDDLITLTPEILDFMLDDDIGKLVDNEFEDIKNELTWAYDSSYNQAAIDIWYNEYSDAIFETLESKKGEYVASNKKDKNGNDIFVYEIKNINFFGLIDNWVVQNKEYETEFQYSNFIDTIQNYLYESDLLSPDPSEWPDSDVVEKYFNEQIQDRI
jgi:hypothetical protein